MRNVSILLGLVLSSAVASGCLLLAAGAGAEGGYVLSQSDDERSAGTVLTDQVLTTKVKSALIATSEVAARNINVDSESGTVTLRGFVRSEAERLKALEVAEGIAGSGKVTSKLTVQTDD